MSKEETVEKTEVAESEKTEVAEKKVKEQKETKSDGEDTLTLGGGIELSGFKVIDLGMMVVVKKIVGSYARKFSDDNKDFEKLRVALDGKKITAELTIGGKSKTGEVEDNNLFVALDAVMKELEKK